MGNENYDLHNIPANQNYNVDTMLIHLDRNVNNSRAKVLTLAEISLLDILRDMN